MSDYRKFIIEMERVTSGYRLWKRGLDTVNCVVETYKNKRSVYFAASNVLPSEVLMREAKKEYHLLLLGVDEGELIHKDFGVLYINSAGEGSLFKKFTGPAIACYTHCLVVALHSESGETETIFSGTMPFFQPEPAEIKTEETERISAELEACAQEQNGFTRCWHEVFTNFCQQESVEIFDRTRDETGARWCRVSDCAVLPDPLESCSNLIAQYGHYTIGRKEDLYFVGIPGRFLQREQPCREQGQFVLWQPIRGGEKYYHDLSEMTPKLQEEIFGYWIGGIDGDSGEIFPL